MSKFDLEEFRDYFLDMVKTNLADKLIEITADKGDSLEIPMPEDHHFIHTVNDQAISFNRFIHYGFSNIEAVGNGAAISYTPTLFFAFYFQDLGKGNVAEQKLLRYTRAMTEVVMEQSTKNAIISALKVEPLPPAIVALADQDGSEWKVGAIEITGSFTA